MGAWALRKDTILVKGQTWVALLQLVCGILTDFEPLELSLIANKSDSQQNAAETNKRFFWKISLVLFFFSGFHVRAGNSFGISCKLNVLITEIVIKF